VLSISCNGLDNCELCEFAFFIKEVYTVKNIIKFFCFIFIGSFVFFNGLTVSALEVNSHEARIGDIVTFDIHAAGCTHPICGIDISVTYDSDALEYSQNSIEFPYITGYFFNDKLHNEIRFNSLSVDGFSFYEDHIIASVSFRVVSDYAPYLYIKYNVNDFTDADLNDYGEDYIYVVTTVSESDTPWEISSQNNDSHSQLITEWENVYSKTASASDNESRLNSNSSNTGSAVIKKTVPQPSYASKPTNDSAKQQEGESVMTADTNEEPETIDIAQVHVSIEKKKSYYKSFIVGSIVVAIAAVIIIIISKSSLKGKHMS